MSLAACHFVWFATPRAQGAAAVGRPGGGGPHARKLNN
ncbi:hypothetical protein J2739_000263 [Variovorax soli]|uniref:Uncharacterized protein n=1 Tax=Variovorax soli TaxID=376815 RepID=A0ABU1N7S5_9BURK|nr:hypothetical protein [Variovorax soli]